MNQNAKAFAWLLEQAALNGINEEEFRVGFGGVPSYWRLLKEGRRSLLRCDLLTLLKLADTAGLPWVDLISHLEAVVLAPAAQVKGCSPKKREPSSDAA